MSHVHSLFVWCFFGRAGTGVMGGGGRWRGVGDVGGGEGKLPSSLKVAWDANKQTKPMTKIVSHACTLHEK